MALPLTALCLALAASQTSPPQGGVFASHSSIDSTVANAGLGQSVAIMEDLDADGVAEVLMGAPFENGIGAVQLQGGGGSTLQITYPGTTAGSMFGWAVTNAGTCSGNAHADILIGAPGVDQAVVYASVLETVWLTLSGPAASSFGWSVVALGDLDDDGFDDFAIGAPNDSPAGLTAAGSVFIYSGNDGTLLRSLHGADAGDHFGYALTALTDNSVIPGGSGGTRAKLLAIGAPDTAAGGFVGVYNARNGMQLFHANGTVLAVGSSFGYSLAAMSDLDGDDLEELAIGAPHYASGAFGFNIGKVEVYSVPNATLLMSRSGEENFNVFGRNVGAADIDGDGTTELIVRSYKSAYDRIEIFSGVNSQLLYAIEGSPELAGLGIGMAGGVDLTGEGFPDLVLGAPLADTAAGTNAGKAAVFGIHTVLSTDRTSLEAEAGGTLTFQLNFPASEQFKAYSLFTSGGVGPITQDGVLVPLSNDSILRYMVLNNPMFPGQEGTLDLSGDAQVSFYVPANTLNTLIGSTLYFAAVSADGNGVRTSSVAVPIDIVSMGGGGGGA
jgi:hypothetical protein